MVLQVQEVQHAQERYKRCMTVGEVSHLESDIFCLLGRLAASADVVPRRFEGMVECTAI